MTRKRLISLGVGLGVIVLTIFGGQVQQDVIVVPDTLRPYVLAAVGFALTTAIPSLWPEAAIKPPGTDDAAWDSAKGVFRSQG